MTASGGALERARDFIAKNRAGVIATVSDNGVPHAAIIYCVVQDDLSLYFSTRVESRKYINLVSNPEVAMVFSNENTMETLQLTGRVSRINDVKLEQEIFHDLMQIRYNEPVWPLPSVKMYEHHSSSELAVLKVVPDEMSYADFSKQKDGTHESYFLKIL